MHLVRNRGVGLVGSALKWTRLAVARVSLAHDLCEEQLAPFVKRRKKS
jgi:hypothetical protein